MWGGVAVFTLLRVAVGFGQRLFQHVIAFPDPCSVGLFCET